MYKQIASNKRKTYLLMIVFLAVILGIGYTYGLIYELGYFPIFFAFIISLVMMSISYFSGDKIALSMSGAKPIEKNDNPYVYRMIENLSITAGLPMPKVYVIDDPALNAFATGRDPKHASIAVTTGIINALENEELEGVLAHELSHIKNYDIRVMMVVIVLVGIVTLLADWLLRSFFWGGDRRSNNNSGAILVIIGLVLAILAPIFAKLVQLAVSRKREYLADASGALLTRYPEGLASALEKISHSQPMRRVNRATAHLFISEPGLDKDHRRPERRRTTKWANLFSTHPPIEKRIDVLRNINSN